MSNAENVKRLSVAHANLLSANRYLEAQLPSSVPSEPVSLANVEMLLSESSLAKCMNDLACLGRTKNPKPAFWRDLERVAQVLRMEHEVLEFRRTFLESLRSGEQSE